MMAAAQKAHSASAVPLSPPSSEQVEELSEGQRKELEVLQELIRRKLEGSKTWSLAISDHKASTPGQAASLA